MMKVKYLVVLLMLLFSFGINAQTVKNFKLKDLENVSRSFSDLKGEKITLIDFWATWCKPCQKAIPELNKIYELYKNEGLNIIGINCDGPRSISKVAPLSKTLKIKYPVLLDIDSEVLNDLNLSALPSLVMVNGEGKIIWIHEGYIQGDEETIKAEIDKKLKTL